MNIILPILINLLTIGVIVIGTVIDKKLGWRLALSKLIIFAGSAVGIYFLMPTLISVIHIDPTIIFSSSLLLIYIITSLIIGILRHKVNIDKLEEINTKRLANVAKPIKGIKKERVKLNKTLLKLPIASKVVGVFISLVLSVVMAYALYLPFKGIIYSHDIDTVEYTLVQQIDNIGLGNLLEEQFNGTIQGE